MYIEKVPNRNSPPAILLRESWREGKKVHKRTLANLTHWPAARVEALQAVLKGASAGVRLEDGFEIVRSVPHGHVAATLGTLKNLGLDQIIGSKKTRRRELCLALIAARIIQPSSKLATSRGLCQLTATSSLTHVLKTGDVDEQELYEAMDWLLKRQAKIEAQLAKRHLCEGALVLYDLTSSYYEGRTCPLAKRGYSRDGKKDKLQIVFALICNRKGIPIAVEVFEGNTADPKTLGTQIEKLRDRFGLKRIVWVGDRGMITNARIREELEPIDGFEWITALRAPAIQALAKDGVIERSLFDEVLLREVQSDAYPGERLIVCRHPLLADERARKRRELLDATQLALEAIVTATRRKSRPLRNKDRIGVRVGKVLNRYKVGKHFEIKITDTSLSYSRKEEQIAFEASLDGFYVIRTSVPKKSFDAEETVEIYKGLSKVERAFRSLKTVDLKVRPIHHRLADRVRAHVFICMLAYYVQWHMRHALSPMLFDDEDTDGKAARRTSVVQKAKRSRSAESKAQTKQTKDGQPAHSFQTLLHDLATLALNRIQRKNTEAHSFYQLTRPTSLQQKAFDLLGLTLRVP